MTTMIVVNPTDRTVVEAEKLPDDTVVWVARDLDLDGCIAQAETREGALSALEGAREDYLDVLRGLGRHPSRPPVVRSDVRDVLIYSIYGAIMCLRADTFTSEGKAVELPAKI